MAINRPSTLRSIDFAIAAISLAVIGTSLGCLVFIAIGHASTASEPAVRRYLLRLAWISLTLLLFVVLVFAWLVVRRVSARMRERRRTPQPTPYLDAWALAGQRFKLSEEDERALAELDAELREPREEPDDRNGQAEDDEE
jgi:membrane protein implicated in regulation of membrane protease activity